MAKPSEKVKGAHPYKVDENTEVAEEYSHWSLIPHVGANYFDGDFRSEMSHPISIPTAGLALEYSFTPVWNLGIEYMFDMYKVWGRTNNPENAEAWLVRIIDDDKAYYAAQDLKLEDGYTVVFKSEGSKFDAVIEVQDQTGAVIDSAEAFAGVLGAN